jgi:CBS domain-containing protein
MEPRTSDFARDATLAKLESKVEEVRCHPPLRVAELMTRDVVSCRVTDTAESCARIMWERACGAVPVVDDENRPISVITDRDICMAAWIQGKPLRDISVASAMSRRLFTVKERDTVSLAERIMRRHNVRRLPVVDKRGELVGMLSVDDITRHGYVPVGAKEDPLSPEAITLTAAALGHPRPDRDAPR